MFACSTMVHEGPVTELLSVWSTPYRANDRYWHYLFHISSATFLACQHYHVHSSS